MPNQNYIAGTSEYLTQRFKPHLGQVVWVNAAITKLYIA